jgi:hypothetical protein
MAATLPLANDAITTSQLLGVRDDRHISHSHFAEIDGSNRFGL